MDPIYLVIAGFLVGLIVGLTGVGGGSLMTPALIFFFGVKPAVAVGTDLLFAAVTKGTGVLAVLRQRVIAWQVVAAMCAGSIPAALVSVWWIHRQSAQGLDIDGVIETTLGIALLLTAAASVYKVLSARRRNRVGGETDRAEASRQAVADGRDQVYVRHPVLPVLLGAAIGAMVAFSSVGAGAVGVIALMVLYPHLPLPRVVASDIAYAVPLTLVTGLSHAGIGMVDWSLLGTLLLGSVPGIWLGSKMVLRVPEQWVRMLLAVLLSLAGGKLLLS